MANRQTSAWTIAGATLIGGLLAYAVYFDYKRRNDTEFRKKLRKQKKRAQNLAATKEEEASPSLDVTTAMLRAVLEEIKPEPYPKTPEERERYFMTEVGLGEQLAVQGPTHYLESAKHFFRALRVYPSPVELIVIYQKTIPEPVFKIVMDLTNLDVSDVNEPAPSTEPERPGFEVGHEDETSPVADRVEGYYNHFPPKSSNVSVEKRDTNKSLLLTKDVKAGEVIYKEFPVVAALDTDIQAAGSHCTHCFRSLDPENALNAGGDDPLSSRYCSEACQSSNASQSHSLLFTLESPLPPSIRPDELPELLLAPRKEAQAHYIAYLKSLKDQNYPLLLARFIARQINIETMKLAKEGQNIPGFAAQAESASKAGYENGDFTDADEGSYGLADHLERMFSNEASPPAEEVALLKRVLATALPGLEAFITDERYAAMWGHIAYNSLGVCLETGRDDRPAPSARPEEVERTRTPHGTSRQIGTAFYLLSSYVNHSCTPSARPTFVSGTTELHIIANKDMKAGDEVTMAWVDVAQQAGESVSECRRRRRYELVRGWKLACECARCEEEAKLVEPETPAPNVEETAKPAEVNGHVEHVAVEEAKPNVEPPSQENGHVVHEQVEEAAVHPAAAVAEAPIEIESAEKAAEEVAHARDAISTPAVEEVAPVVADASAEPTQEAVTEPEPATEVKEEATPAAVQQ